MHAPAYCSVLPAIESVDACSQAQSLFVSEPLVVSTKIGLCGRCTRLADIVRRNLGGATESKLSELSRNREQVGRERPDGVIVETAF